MSKYFGIKYNDIVDGEGICVSLWTAGCPHRCPGCHNSEMWNYENGYDVPADIQEQIINAISANGIIRNFSVLGGEPLSLENLSFVNSIIAHVRTSYPKIKIFLWTGYTLGELQEHENQNKDLENILNNIDVLIDGRYVQEKRNITLKLRGSSNQRVLYKDKDF